MVLHLCKHTGTHPYVLSAFLPSLHPADPERQRECEELLGPLTSERFAELVALGKLITDYVGEGETIVPNDEEGIDDDIGVAVEVGGRCL